MTPISLTALRAMLLPGLIVAMRGPRKSWSKSFHLRERSPVKPTPFGTWKWITGQEGVSETLWVRKRWGSQRRWGRLEERARK